MKKQLFLFFFLTTLCSCVSTGNNHKAEESTSGISETENIPEIVPDIILKGKDISGDMDYLESQGVSFLSLMFYNYYEEVSYENGTLLIIWTYNNIYAANNFLEWRWLDHPEVSKIVRFFWRNNNESYTEPVSGKWFSVNGNPEMISIATNTPQKMDTYNDLSFRIKDEGISTLIVTFQEKKIALNFNLIIIPITTGFKDNASKTDDIIRKYGLPDDIKPFSIEWPDKGIISGFYYKPDVGRAISGEHWRFKDYPDLVFDVLSNGYIRGITTNRDKNFYKRSE